MNTISELSRSAYYPQEEMYGVWSRRFQTERTWREVVEKDCQARKLNKDDGMGRSRWRKLTKDVRWSEWVWVSECFFWYQPTQVVPDKGPLSSCVCAYYPQNVLFRRKSKLSLMPKSKSSKCMYPAPNCETVVTSLQSTMHTHTHTPV